MKLYEMAVHKPVIVTIGTCHTSRYRRYFSRQAADRISTADRLSFYRHLCAVSETPFLHTSSARSPKPLEEVFSTLGDVKEIFSESSSDGCFVGVVFDWGRDVNVLRMEVKEKVDQIRSELPQDIEQIQLFTFNSNDQPIMVGRISAKGKDLMGSYDLLEKTIINPIKRIEGVGRVGIDGIEPQEISIYLEINKIKAHHVRCRPAFSAHAIDERHRLDGRGDEQWLALQRARPWAILRIFARWRTSP